MALIPYWQELKGDEPEFSKKASRISHCIYASQVSRYVLCFIVEGLSISHGL
jgi:hypothetical protein